VTVAVGGGGNGATARQADAGDEEEPPLLECLAGPVVVVSAEAGEGALQPRLPLWLARLVSAAATTAATGADALPPPFAGTASSLARGAAGGEPAIAAACALEATAFTLPMVCAGDDGGACAGLPDFVDAKVIAVRGPPALPSGGMLF
jgi:hypothetical protein